MSEMGRNASADVGRDTQMSPELEYVREDVENIYTLISYLEQEVGSAPLLPLTNKRILNSEVFLQIISDMRHALPAALQNAKNVFDERDSILGEAEALAEEIIEDAKAKAENRDQTSQFQANAMRDDADKYVRQRRADAEAQANHILQDAENQARHLVEQSTILRRATEEANEILNNARAEANDRMLSAAGYEENELIKMEQVLQSAIESSRRRRQMIGKE